MKTKQVLFPVLSFILAVLCASCASVQEENNVVDSTPDASAAFMRDYEAYKAAHSPIKSVISGAVKPATSVSSKPAVLKTTLLLSKNNASSKSVVLQKNNIAPMNNMLTKNNNKLVVQKLVAPKKPAVQTMVQEAAIQSIKQPTQSIKQPTPVKPVQNQIASQVKNVTVTPVELPRVVILPKNLPVTNIQPTQAPVQSNKTWQIDLDDKVISATITKWAMREGYTLIWDAKADFQIQTPSTLHGSLKDVINEVLKSFKETGNPLRANWYTNKVVKITSAGNVSSSDTTNN